MNPRLYPAVLLAAVVAGGAQAADQTMEHVEVIGYQVPAVVALAADGEALTAQPAEQHRRELLRTMRELQRRQLETVRLEGVITSAETVARKTSTPQQKQRAPTSAENASGTLEQPLKPEQKTGEIPPAQDAEGEQTMQEPS